jgi:hypothetical protein
VKVLCTEKNIDLIVCNLSSFKLDSISTNKENTDNNDFEINESQLSQFEQFLFKSSRYCVDQIFKSESQLSSKRLLFIKEIPNSAYYNQTGFQNILRKFLKFSKCSLCFSFNLTSNVSWEINPFKLFTNEIKTELKITEISFNSFANSFLLKAVNRIIQLESLQTLITKEEINDVCSMSNGDLRYAINCLEFYFSKKKKKSTIKKVTEVPKKVTSAKLKAMMDEKILKGSVKDNIKDVNLNLFRGLGKILHRKHYDSATVEENFQLDKYNELCRVENSLPKNLNSKLRPPLNAVPEDVYSKLTLSTDSILLFLHQNYLEMFTDRSYTVLDETFDGLSDINDAFCLSDLLTSRNSNIEYSSRSACLNELSAVVSMRALMFNLYTTQPKQQKQQQSQQQNKGMWKPLYRPYYNKSNEIIKTRKEKAIELFLNNQNDNFKLSCSKTEFFQTILPFICVNSNSSMKFKQKLNTEQKNFINQFTAQIHLANNNNSNNKFKSFNTSIFSSLRIGQNDIYSTNDNDEDDGNTEGSAQSNVGQIKNDAYDYDDGVNITEFKF